jgi:hypothetical protein
MECALGCLKSGEKYSGVIVKEPNGHRFVTAFTNKKDHAERIKDRLNMVREKGRKVEIIETIISKEREYILKRIQKLNIEGGVTGVNTIPKELS